MCKCGSVHNHAVPVWDEAKWQAQFTQVRHYLFKESTEGLTVFAYLQNGKYARLGLSFPQAKQWYINTLKGLTRSQMLTHADALQAYGSTLVRNPAYVGK